MSMRKTAIAWGLSLLLAAAGHIPAAGQTTPGGDPPPPPAKAVIQIWMWGGPSQLDTFDPKPEAGPAYMGPKGGDIATNVEGVRIASGLPLLAAMADKYSIIRSMTHGVNAHETAAYLMQTGHGPGIGLVYPSLGAVVSYFKGASAPSSGLLPPYIVLTESQGRFPEEGFLGPAYKPFVTGGDPAKPVFAVEGIVSEGLDAARQVERRNLLHSLDSLGKAASGLPAFVAHDAAEEEAYGMILGKASSVFDLSSEDPALRDRYGRSSFGQACLVARRLVEQGVPYITINYRGWDGHKRIFEYLDQHLPELDRGLSALLADLSARGLLDSTIVLWGGEFGRTPKVDWDAPWNGGRGHYGAAFSVLLAGGGFKGGRVVGATDARGEAVVSRPVYPQDLIGSILERLGIDPAGSYPATTGHPVPILPPLDPRPGHGILKELY
jgi:hypothetical protein